MQLTLALEESLKASVPGTEIPVCETDMHGLISFAGKQFICDPEGTLFWPEKKCLIVSDLHLEKGASCARRGQMIPPYDTALTLRRLEAQIAKWQPQTVISLGDSFHDEYSANTLPSLHIGQLKRMAQNRRWIWITGNHDRALPEFLEGEVSKNTIIDGVPFTHEPTKKLSVWENEICGHLHPKARIVQRGKRISRKCFAHDKQRMIMPAFGAYTGGLDLSHEAFEGLFQKTRIKAVLLGRERVYQISGKNLALR